VDQKKESSEQGMTEHPNNGVRTRTGYRPNQISPERRKERMRNRAQALQNSERKRDLSVTQSGQEIEGATKSGAAEARLSTKQIIKKTRQKGLSSERKAADEGGKEDSSIAGEGKKKPGKGTNKQICP